MIALLAWSLMVMLAALGAQQVQNGLKMQAVLNDAAWEG